MLLFRVPHSCPRTAIYIPMYITLKTIMIPGFLPCYRAARDKDLLGEPGKNAAYIQFAGLVLPDGGLLCYREVDGLPLDNAPADQTTRHT